MWGELQNGWLSSSSSSQPPGHACLPGHEPPVSYAPDASLRVVSLVNSPKRIAGNCNITNLHEGPSVMSVRREIQPESSNESGNILAAPPPSIPNKNWWDAPAVASERGVGSGRSGTVLGNSASKVTKISAGNGLNQHKEAMSPVLSSRGLFRDNDAAQGRVRIKAHAELRY